MARSVACRSWRPAVAVSSLKRSLMRESSVARRHHAHARCRQLDRERQAVEQARSAHRSIRDPRRAARNRGAASRARWVNSAAPSAGGSGASGSTDSPPMPSTLAGGDEKACIGGAIQPAARASPRRASATCSKLSRMTRHDRRAAIALPSCATGSSCPSGTSSALRDGVQRCRPGCAPATGRRTRHRRGIRRASPRRSGWRARVFPVPPKPSQR